MSSTPATNASRCFKSNGAGGFAFVSAFASPGPEEIAIDNDANRLRTATCTCRASKKRRKKAKNWKRAPNATSSTSTAPTGTKNLQKTALQNQRKNRQRSRRKRNRRIRSRIRKHPRSQRRRFSGKLWVYVGRRRLHRRLHQRRKKPTDRDLVQRISPHGTERRNRSAARLPGTARIRGRSERRILLRAPTNRRRRLKNASNSKRLRSSWPS